MRTFEYNFDNLTPRRCLHRVLKSTCEGDRTRLVARWIDPETQKSQPHENGDANNGDGAVSRGLVLVGTSRNAFLCFCRLRTSAVATAA